MFWWMKFKDCEIAFLQAITHTMLLVKYQGENAKWNRVWQSCETWLAITYFLLIRRRWHWQWICWQAKAGSHCWWESCSRWFMRKFDRKLVSLHPYSLVGLCKDAHIKIKDQDQGSGDLCENLTGNCFLSTNTVWLNYVRMSRGSTGLELLL